MKIMFLALFFSIVSQAQVNLQAAYTNIQKQATVLSGRPQDIAQRIQHLKQMYVDSKGKYAFPLVAAHGAKFAKNLFGVTQTASGLFSVISQMSSSENLTKANRLSEMTSAFSTQLENVNRFVFIDTYTNYYFSKIYGRHAGADQFIPARLLSSLNHMHLAASLNETEKRALFHEALLYEQHTRVSPMVTQVCGSFSEKWLLPLVLKPLVHFSYFPKSVYFQFKDFSSESERIHYALKSYDLAAQVGWAQVYKAL